MTDEALMAAIQAGDRQAYAQVVNNHVRPVNRYIVRMLGSQSDAEDIAQETFLRLWTQAHTWQPGKAALSTWLHRIAHNLCIDYLRRDKSGVSSEYLDDYATEESPEKSFAQKAGLEALEKAMQQLPERQRSALILTHYQGLANREVAEIMDISVDALESVLARARRSLKTQLLAADNMPPANTNAVKIRVREHE